MEMIRDTESPGGEPQIQYHSKMIGKSTTLTPCALKKKAKLTPWIDFLSLDKIKMC